MKTYEKAYGCHEMLKLHVYNRMTLRHLKKQSFCLQVTVVNVACAKHTVPIPFKPTSYSCIDFGKYQNFKMPILSY